MKLKKVLDNCKNLGKSCVVSAINFSVRRLNAFIAILAGLLLVVASLAFLWAYERTQDLLVEQMLHRQQLTGRAGAKSLESVIEMAAISIADLADNPAIETKSSEVQEILNDYVDRWGFNRMAGVAIIDKQGVIVHHATISGSNAVGSDVSDRDYFNWAKDAEAGDVFINDPIVSRFGESEGNTILVFSTPIVADGEFMGVVSSAYLLSGLANDYLEPLRATQNTKIQLIDEEGNLIYSSYPELIGENVLEQIANNPTGSNIDYSNKLRNVIENPKEEKFDFKLVTPKGDKPERILIAITPVRHLDGEKNSDDRYWLLAIATPADDAHVFMGDFLQSSTALIIIVVLVIITLTLLIVVLVRVAQRDAYLDGFVYGRDQMDRRRKK